MHRLELFLNVSILVLFLLNARIAYLCHTSIVAVALGTLGIEVELLNVDFVLLYAIDKLLLRFPLGVIFAFSVAQVGKFFIKLSHLLRVAFTLYRLTFNLELGDFTHYLVEGLRYRVNFKTQLSSSLIDKVNSLVGEETVGNITLRKLYGCNNRLITDTHLVVIFISFLQSTENCYCAFLIRFIDHYFLEPALKCLILLEVFLIFIESSCTDAAKLATCKCRFQNICSVHSAFTLTCTHKGVDFIDKEDNLAIRLYYLINDSLESLLKFALILGTCNKSSHIEREHLLALQVLRNITTHNALCKTFGNSSLTGTRLTYKHRIVFGTSAQNLKYTANFIVTTDNRVELTATCTLIQVDCIFLQCIVLVFGTLLAHSLAFAKLIDSLIEIAFGDSGILHNSGSGVVRNEDTQQHHFKRHILVASFLGTLRCLFKSII